MEWLALLPLAVVSPSSISTPAVAPGQDLVQEAKPKDFWWDDKPPPIESTSPIHPDHWLIVPEGAPLSPSQVYTRYLLDPSGGLPDLADASGRGIWHSVQARIIPRAVAAYTCIGSDRDEVRMAHLSGAELLFVNGEGFAGDSLDRGHRGVPVALRKGDNHFFILGFKGPVELELWVAETRAVLATWDVAWPGEIPSADDFAYPVFNASTETAEYLHVHYGHAVVEGSTCSPDVSEWRDGGTAPPLGVIMAGSYFDSMHEECERPSEQQTALVPICVYFQGDSNPDEQILRRGPASQLGKRGERRTSRSVSAIAGSPLTRLSADAACLLYGKMDLGRARFDQQLSWYRTWVAPEMVSAEMFVSTPALRDGPCNQDRMYWIQQSCQFVIYGNSNSNPAWERFVPTGLIDVGGGVLRIGTSEFRGDDICGWFAFRRSRDTTVVVVADTGERGRRLGYLVQPLFSDAEGLDYAFWDAGGEDGAPRLIASGKFPL